MSFSRILGLALAALLAFALPSAASAAEPVPPVVMGHARAYVAAVNADGAAAAEAFHREHSTKVIVEAIPIAAVTGYFANQHRVLGGVELIEVRMTDPVTAVALLRGKLYGALIGVTMNLDLNDGLKVIEFDPGPAPDWAPPAGAALSSAQVGAETRALAAKGCGANVFSGAFLVAKGRDVLATGACGQANRRYGVENTIETRINLGSMDKMFTAVSVMQLVEAGRIGLDDPLSRYLDDSWLPKEVSDRITIRHLLTHTSGLDSFLNAEFRQSSPTRFRKLADYKPLIHDEKPSFEPGEGYQYSNTGMLLLGAVIEAVSGEDYYDYVQRHIFRPLGMNDTGAWSMEDPVPNVAVGYFVDASAPLGWRENTLRYLYRGVPAGGGYSTVGDIHRFAMGLLDDRLISRASRDYLWTRNLPNEYGAGFMITGSGAGRIVGHEGSYLGVSSQLEIYVDKGYVVVLLGNQDWAAPGLGDAIRGLVTVAL
jgi:CubicO group peptidase (beta-lactamase class C family)